MPTMKTSQLVRRGQLVTRSRARARPSSDAPRRRATPASTSSGDGAQARPLTAAAAPAALPKPEAIAKDSPRTTAAGHTFTAPAGWTLYANGGTRVLEGPEKDVKLALVDVTHAADAADAVKQAWPSLDPKFARPLHIAQDIAGALRLAERQAVRLRDLAEREAHGARHRAQEGRRVVRDARRRRDAAMEQRGSQINLIAGSLRPAGYTRESFARQEGAPARRGARQGAHRLHREGARKGAGRARRRPSGSSITARSSSPAASACASSASRRRSTPTRSSSSRRTPRR